MTFSFKVRLAQNDIGDTSGSRYQMDEDIHLVHEDVNLVIEKKYRFWVAIDENGDGLGEVLCTPGGVLITPSKPSSIFFKKTCAFYMIISTSFVLF